MDIKYTQKKDSNINFIFDQFSSTAYHYYSYFSRVCLYSINLYEQLLIFNIFQHKIQKYNKQVSHNGTNLPPQRIDRITKIPGSILFQFFGVLICWFVLKVLIFTERSTHILIRDQKNSKKVFIAS